MQNKVLIRVIVPQLENSYDLFIPINRQLFSIVFLVKKAVMELEGVDVMLDTSGIYNRSTGFKYNHNSFVLDTNIRNGTVLVIN